MDDIRHTNTAAIDIFENALKAYENEVPVSSNNLSAFHQSAKLLKSALDRLIISEHQDTLSMMRILMDHVVAGIDTSYSDMTLSMVAAASVDPRGRDLIYAIPYIACEMVNGEQLVLDDAWLVRVAQNKAIHSFFMNYSHSDQSVLEETYSGNIVKATTERVMLTTDDLNYALEVGHSSYLLEFTSSYLQTLSFKLTEELEKRKAAMGEERLTVVGEVIITPKTGSLIIDSSVTFLDDAAAQVNALKCAPFGIRKGLATHITLPGVFYRLALNFVSYDAGSAWRITEVNILPPSTN